MKIKRLEEKIKMPEGVSANFEGEMLLVKGPKGENKKQFRDVFVKIIVEEDEIIVFAENATKRQKRIVGTFNSHIKNMVKGVTEGFIYKLRICSGHFPMNVTCNNGEFVVKNFNGEKIPRSYKLVENVNVKIEGTDIVVDGTSKEDVGQVAGSIEGLTKRPGFDTRIFQAGIYIIEKPGRAF